MESYMVDLFLFFVIESYRLRLTHNNETLNLSCKVRSQKTLIRKKYCCIFMSVVKNKIMNGKILD